MSESAEFAVGDNVVAVAGARGTIADVREMSNGDTAYGVVDTTGSVRYYTVAALKHVITP